MQPKREKIQSRTQRVVLKKFENRKFPNQNYKKFRDRKRVSGTYLTFSRLLSIGIPALKQVVMGYIG